MSDRGVITAANVPTLRTLPTLEEKHALLARIAHDRETRSAGRVLPDSTRDVREMRDGHENEATDR